MYSFTDLNHHFQIYTCIFVISVVYFRNVAIVSEPAAVACTAALVLVIKSSTHPTYKAIVCVRYLYYTYLYTLFTYPIYIVYYMYTCVCPGMSMCVWEGISSSSRGVVGWRKIWATDALRFPRLRWSVYIMWVLIVYVVYIYLGEILLVERMIFGSIYCSVLCAFWPGPTVLWLYGLIRRFCVCCCCYFQHLS